MNYIQDENNALEKCKALLLEVCGFKFGDDRANFLKAALKQRIAKRGIDTLIGYYELLNSDCYEFQCLLELLTVNETYFFREPEHLKMLVDRLIPELLTKTAWHPLKIISAGCSSGAEPYSVAILLRECFGARSEELFSITGIDIDSTVIDSAKHGIYGKGFFRTVDPALVARYFTPGNFGEMYLKDEIKSQVSFQIVNLLRDDFSKVMQRVSVVLYRNVSIYFPPHIQRVIFSKLAEALDDGGYLIVGASETIHHDIGILSLVERDGLYVYQKLPAIPVKERRSSIHDKLMGGSPSPSVSSDVSLKKRSESRAAMVQTIPANAGKNISAQKSLQNHNDITTVYDNALALASAGKNNEALVNLVSLTNADQTFVPALLLAASIHISAGHYVEARSAAQAALTNDSLCLVALLMLGIIEHHEGNTDRAYSRFREAKFLTSSCWLASVYMAEIDFIRNDKQRALNNYASALALLEKGFLEEMCKDFFPMTLKAEQYLQLCRHKMSLLKQQGS